MVEVRLSAADCATIYILAYGGFAQTLHWALPLEPAGDFRPPGPLCPPNLPSKPGYATGNVCRRSLIL